MLRLRRLIDPSSAVASTQEFEVEQSGNVWIAGEGYSGYCRRVTARSISKSVPPSRPVRIMVVDDSELALRMVVDLIETFKNIEVVGTANSGAKALKLVPQVLPDVAVVDLQMPEVNGLETCSNIVRKYPGVRVVLMTAADPSEFQDVSMAAGARKFLMKNRLSAELHLYVDQVHEELNRRRD